MTKQFYISKNPNKGSHQEVEFCTSDSYPAFNKTPLALKAAQDMFEKGVGIFSYDATVKVQSTLK